MDGFTITELSSGNSGNTSPQIFGDNVVWQSEVDGNTEIFLYNGSETIQLTDNDVADNFPQISGENVVWQGGNEGGDTEIFFYNGSETIQLTDNDVADNFPQISGDNVVWQGGNEGGDTEIFFYNGSETIQLTDNDVADNFPQISGDNVVWQGGNEGGDTEIFLYNGSETIQLTDNDVADNFPQISGGNVVWQNGSENEREIFLYNGNETIKLTNNDVPDVFGSGLSSIFTNNIVGDNVIWQSGTEDNVETLFYNGSETIQITNGGVIDSAVFEDSVADEFIDEFDSDSYYYAAGSGNEIEVFVYDGNETIQLTDNDVPESSPKISVEGNAIWQRLDTSDSGEQTISLFLATPNDVDPVSGTTVYRFLNEDTGVHFYTADETERDAVQELSNYSFEGASYESVDTLTGNPEPEPVYRFLNEDTGVHLYTVSEAEREATAQLDNFSFEGEAFSAYATEIEGSIPIYRFFNSDTGAHFYTPSADERDNVEENLPDYQSEGIAYYALPLDDSQI